MNKKVSARPIESIYNQLAPVYNFVYGKLFFNEGRRTAIELLDLQAGDKVLEVGVGTGLTLPMYPIDCTIVGIDLSEGMLEEARQLIKKQHIHHASVKFMNANHLEFADDSFDAVLGNLFISATSDPVGAMNEMKRVCKPGGTLVLMNHFKSKNKIIGGMERAILPFAHRLGFDSALDLDELLARTGLESKRLEKVNLFNMWTAVAMTNSKTQSK